MVLFRFSSVMMDHDVYFRFPAGTICHWLCAAGLTILTRWGSKNYENELFCASNQHSLDKRNSTYKIAETGSGKQEILLGSFNNENVFLPKNNQDFRTKNCRKTVVQLHSKPRLPHTLNLMANIDSKKLSNSDHNELNDVATFAFTRTMHSLWCAVLLSWKIKQ